MCWPIKRSSKNEYLCFELIKPFKIYQVQVLNLHVKIQKMRNHGPVCNFRLYTKRWLGEKIANETVVGDIFCLFETRKKKKLTIHREFETSLSYKLSSLAGNRSIRKIFKSLAESLIWVLFFISIPQKSPSLFKKVYIFLPLTLIKFFFNDVKSLII